MSLIEDSILASLSETLERGSGRERYRLRIANFEEIESTDAIIRDCIKTYVDTCNDFKASPATVNFNVSRSERGVTIHTDDGRPIEICKSNVQFQIAATTSTVTVFENVQYHGQLIGAKVIVKRGATVHGEMYTKHFVADEGSDTTQAKLVPYNYEEKYDDELVRARMHFL